jgi:hypothetical protein
MSNPIIRIHNISTDTITDREMTDEEFAQYEADQVVEAARVVAKAEAEAAKAAAQAKLTALGLTVEDLQALGL